MESATNVEYALENAWAKARRRLACMEATYDPGTLQRLAALGVEPGMRCLEVGAGSGSVARWLADRVGPDGSVVAVDLDVQLLSDMPDNVEVRRLDVRVDPLPEAQFDVVHTRMLLIHLAEREQVLDKLVAAVRPGGWLIVEESDTFARARLDADDLHAAMVRTGTDLLARTAHVDLGRELPPMLRERGLGEIAVHCEIPVVEGGSLPAEWMHLTFEQLRGRDGGGVDDEVFRRWREMLGRPGRWFTGIGLMSVRGRRTH